MRRYCSEVNPKKGFVRRVIRSYWPMKKRFSSNLLSTPQHPEADRRHIARGVVRYGLRSGVELTAEQRAELDRRLDAYEANGDAGRPADEIIDDIRKRLGLRNKAK